MCGLPFKLGVGALAGPDPTSNKPLLLSAAPPSKMRDRETAWTAVLKENQDVSSPRRYAPPLPPRRRVFIGHRTTLQSPCSACLSGDGCLCMYRRALKLLRRTASENCHN